MCRCAYAHTDTGGHYVPAFGQLLVTLNSAYAKNLKGMGEFLDAIKHALVDHKFFSLLSSNWEWLDQS